MSAYYRDKIREAETVFNNNIRDLKQTLTKKLQNLSKKEKEEENDAPSDGFIFNFIRPLYEGKRSEQIRIHEQRVADATKEHEKFLDQLYIDEQRTSLELHKALFDRIFDYEFEELLAREPSTEPKANAFANSCGVMVTGHGIDYEADDPENLPIMEYIRETYIQFTVDELEAIETIIGKIDILKGVPTGLCSILSNRSLLPDYTSTEHDMFIVFTIFELFSKYLSDRGIDFSLISHEDRNTLIQIVKDKLRKKNRDANDKKSYRKIVKESTEEESQDFHSSIGERELFTLVKMSPTTPNRELAFTDKGITSHKLHTGLHFINLVDADGSFLFDNSEETVVRSNFVTVEDPGSFTVKKPVKKPDFEMNNSNNNAFITRLTAYLERKGIDSKRKRIITKILRNAYYDGTGHGTISYGDIVVLYYCMGKTSGFIIDNLCQRFYNEDGSTNREPIGLTRTYTGKRLRAQKDGSAMGGAGGGAMGGTIEEGDEDETQTERDSGEEEEREGQGEGEGEGEEGDEAAVMKEEKGRGGKRTNKKYRNVARQSRKRRRSQKNRRRTRRKHHRYNF